MTDHAELRRQATAAGVFVDFDDFDDEPDEVGPAEFDPVTGTYATSSKPEPAPITAAEAEQLLVWLQRWTDARRKWETERDRREYDAVYRDMVLEQSRSGFSVPFQRPVPPPEGFELLQHSWCPRCDRDGGDPLGRRTIGHWVTYFPDTAPLPEQRKPVRTRPYCEIVPAPPELEIAPACHRQRWTGRYGGPGMILDPCGARRLFRWGLRRAEYTWQRATEYLWTFRGERSADAETRSFYMQPIPINRERK
jgi:hypothetical protein